jgi:recombination protein RecT
MLQNIAHTISKSTVFTHLDEGWFQEQLGKALPSFLKADKFTRMCRTELKQNLNLQQCDPLSVTGALIQSAELGLVPASILGQVYLIPRFNRKKGKTQCQMMVGYRGMLELARRSGQVKTIHAFIVYANDTFKIKYGFSPRIDHIPSTENRGDFKCVYAVATLKSGEKQFEMMTRQEVLQIKTQAKKSDNDLQTIWEDHFDEMARKTVIRRLFKYLPVSLEMNQAVGLDEQWERAEQDNDGVIETSQSNIVSFPLQQNHPAPESPKEIVYKTPEWIEGVLPETPRPEKKQTLTEINEAKPATISLQQFEENLAKVSKGIAVTSSAKPSAKPKTSLELMQERMDEQKLLQQVKGMQALERLKQMKTSLQDQRQV